MTIIFRSKTSFNSALVHAHSLVTLDHHFSTFKGSRLLDILLTNFFPRLATFVSLLSKYDDLYQPTVSYGRHSHGCTTYDSGCCSELLATLGDSQLELATIPCTIQCYVVCLSPVQLWPEKVCGSCSVCVKAAAVQFL